MSLQPQTAELFKRIVTKFATPLRKGPQVYPGLATLYDRAALICNDIDDLHRFRFPPKRMNPSDCPPIYLKPVEAENMVPILRLAYDFTTANSPRIALRLMLVKLHSDKFCALGYRFETGAGAHAYFHCQLIRGFDKADKFDAAMPNWMPETHPAFCLDANKPLHLLAVCFISLYGMSEWAKHVSADNRLTKDLRKYLSGMHLHG